MSLLLYSAAVLVLIYAVAGLTLLFMQPRLLYRPTREISLTPADIGLDFEEVSFQSKDGVMLSGWYVPVQDAKFTVLFCHGNAGNIMHGLDNLRLFHELRLSCFIFDYRGYGRSTGKPRESGTYRDARAACEWLVREKHVSVEQIILFGHSLGASIAAHLAGRVQVRGLVVEGAFTSYPDMGARFYPYMPVRIFAFFRYNTRAHIRRVHCPVMVMHSKHDELVPFEFGVRLYEAANEPKRFVETVGSHNDSLVASGETYREAWRKWLDFVSTSRTES
jgi:pimeloyl-ACP methyl ester carboxylesterase